MSLYMLFKWDDPHLFWRCKKMQQIEFIFFFSFFVFEKKRHLVTVWSFASLKMHQIQWNKKQNKDKWMYLIVDNFILVLDGRGKGKLICYTHALALSSQKKFKCIFFLNDLTWWLLQVAFYHVHDVYDGCRYVAWCVCSVYSVQGKKHECGLHVMVIAGVNTTR